MYNLGEAHLAIPIPDLEEEANVTSLGRYHDLT